MNKFGYLRPAQDNLSDLELERKIELTFGDSFGKEQDLLCKAEIMTVKFSVNWCYKAVVNKKDLKIEN